MVSKAEYINRSRCGHCFDVVSCKGNNWDDGSAEVSFDNMDLKEVLISKLTECYILAQL